MPKNSAVVERPRAAAEASPYELGARSLTAAIYARLRTEIITNQLEQGEKLHLASLQERYGVSLSVVREALSRLVADGLVVAEAQRGFRVSAISKSDLVDLTRTRIGIEGMAIELAIENGDKQWQASVKEAYERLGSIVRTTHVDEWSNAHGNFHRLLVAPCGSPWLMRFREVLFEQSERYRYIAVDRARPPKAAEIEAHHRALVLAVQKRDSAKAKEAIALHYALLQDRVLTIKGLA